MKKKHFIKFITSKVKIDHKALFRIREVALAGTDEALMSFLILVMNQYLTQVLEGKYDCVCPECGAEMELDIMGALSE